MTEGAVEKASVVFSMIFPPYKARLSKIGKAMTLRERFIRGLRLLIRASLWIDAALVGAVMLIELLGVYLAGGTKFSAAPLRDPIREWIGEW